MLDVRMKAGSETHGDDIAQLFKKGLRVRAKHGDIVTRGDNNESWVYLLEDGFIKEYSIDDEGNEYLQLIYKPGEIFPLIWAAAGIKKRSFYEALADSTLWKLPRSDFMDSIRAGATAVNLAVFDLMATQFSAFVDRLDNLQYKTAQKRVVYRLLFLASRFGEKKDGQIIIQAPISQKLLADSINLTRETASRVLEELNKKHLISTADRHIVLLDIKELFNLLDDPLSLNHWGLD